MWPEGQWETSKTMGDCFAPLGSPLLPRDSMAQTHTHTYTHRHGHSMTESAQWGRFSENINIIQVESKDWQSMLRNSATIDSIHQLSGENEPLAGFLTNGYTLNKSHNDGLSQWFIIKIFRQIASVDRLHQLCKIYMWAKKKYCYTLK